MQHTLGVVLPVQARGDEEAPYLHGAPCRRRRRAMVLQHGIHCRLGPWCARAAYSTLRLTLATQQVIRARGRPKLDFKPLWRKAAGAPGIFRAHHMALHKRLHSRVASGAC